MLKISGVTRSFDNKLLLRGISFQLSKGERLSLLGPGGCGKSTLLKILLGLIKPEKGEVSILGESIFSSSEKERLKLMSRVGVAFQQDALFDFMTVLENLLFAMEHMTDKNEQEMAIITKDLLEEVKLPHARDLFPHELSGGMRRRVGVARALCTEPEIAFFDEPTSGLDPVTSTIILNMIMELSKKKQSSLLVFTSNVEIAIRFSSRLLILKDGKIIADDLWKNLLLSEDPWIHKFLSSRLIGLDIEYAKGLGLPESFIERYW